MFALQAQMNFVVWLLQLVDIIYSWRLDRFLLLIELHIFHGTLEALQCIFLASAKDLIFSTANVGGNVSRIAMVNLDRSFLLILLTEFLLSSGTSSEVQKADSCISWRTQSKGIILSILSVR